MQSIIHADAANILPAFMSTVDGHAKKVKGLVPIPLGNLSGWSFTDRVWFEARRWPPSLRNSCCRTTRCSRSG